MDGFAAFGAFAGGVGLFLLGMVLMTEGLKLAAGSALERILANSTRTRLRGLAAGVLVTALVQSSSAVTVATIGFVNAGLLNLAQALWVLFGANVGTTMTGWLVALVGLQFKIEALALPFVGLGMLLRLTGEGSRRGAAGTALAGFGLLFLGIDMLREAFSGLSSDFALPLGHGALDTLLRVLTGIALTVMMQSSSAALVVALTAAQSGLLSVQAAAAVVIGANLGTTVTALIAAIGATSNARRAAAAHILFNLLTGVVALLLLPWMIVLLGVGREWLGFDEAPAAKLALFHTAFNVLGVILIWPLVGRLTAFLEGRFRSVEEDEARPRYLDQTVLAVPALALDALEREVRNMGCLSIASVRGAIAAPAAEPPLRHKQVIARLNRAIAEFIVELNRLGMSTDSARRLPEILRLARYYETAAELAAEAMAAAPEARGDAAHELAEEEGFRKASSALLNQCDAMNAAIADDHAMTRMQDAYQALKARLIELGAQGKLTLEEMDSRLRAASCQRGALEQIAQAAQMVTSSAIRG